MKRTTLTFSTFLLKMALLTIFIFANTADTQARHKPLNPEYKMVKLDRVFSGEINVAVASSLIDAVTEIANNYQKKYPEHTVNISSSGSGTLARQIENGAPFNVFISASTKWINYLDEKDLLDKNYIKRLPIRNVLVLIGNKKVKKVNTSNMISYLAKNKAKIALGDPNSVPVGEYSKEFLTNSGLFSKIEKYAVFVNSVRTATRYIQLGEVELAIVYSTDAVSLKKNEYNLLETLDPLLYGDIRYTAAIVAENHSLITTSFFKYLLSDEAIEIIKKYGYKAV